MDILVYINNGIYSVASILILKELGYDISAIYIEDDKYNNIDNVFNYNDAKNICSKLCIPLYLTHINKNFKDIITNYYINENKNKKEPNYNYIFYSSIIFNILLNEAKKLNINKIALTLQARIEGNKLLRGININQDDSFYLSMVNKEILKNILLPIGNLTKEKIINLLNEYNLNEYINVNSENIISIYKTYYKNYIIDYLKENNININKDNEVLCNKIELTNINYISSKHPAFATIKLENNNKEIPIIIDYTYDNIINILFQENTYIKLNQSCVIYLGNECIMHGIVNKIIN